MRTGKLAARTARALALGYRITEDGHPISPQGRLLVATPNPYGYLKFSIPRAGDSDRIVYIHQLAALQRFGKKALRPGVQVRHLNGQTADNGRANISLGGPSNNQMDISPELRRARSEKAAKAAADVVRRFTPETVRIVRNRHAEGQSIHGLALAFDASVSTISYMVNRRTYADVL